MVCHGYWLGRVGHEVRHCSPCSSRCKLAGSRPSPTSQRGSHRGRVMWQWFIKLHDGIEEMAMGQY